MLVPPQADPTTTPMWLYTHNGWGGCGVSIHVTILKMTSRCVSVPSLGSRALGLCDYCEMYDLANTSFRDDALEEVCPQKGGFGLTAWITDFPKVSETCSRSALAAALQKWLYKAHSPPQVLHHLGQGCGPCSHSSLEHAALPLLTFCCPHEKKRNETGEGEACLSTLQTSMALCPS